MNWAQLGGSLAAVLALAGTAWALKLGRGGGIGSAVDASQAAEAALAGFAAADAVVGSDGAAALVIARDGRLAVLKRHGAQIAVREVSPGSVSQDGDTIRVETGERRFGRVTIAGVDRDALARSPYVPPVLRQRLNPRTRCQT